MLPSSKKNLSVTFFVTWWFLLTGYEWHKRVFCCENIDYIDWLLKTEQLAASIYVAHEYLNWTLSTSVYGRVSPKLILTAKLSSLFIFCVLCELLLLFLFSIKSCTCNFYFCNGSFGILNATKFIRVVMMFENVGCHPELTYWGDINRLLKRNSRVFFSKAIPLSAKTLAWSGQKAWISNLAIHRS